MIPAPLSELWARHFDGHPECLAQAPGRVNLIGEHTDYNEGYVFPAAISRRTYALLRLSAGETSLISGQAGPGQPFGPSSPTPTGWARYAAACARALEDRLGEPAPGIEGVIWSDVPGGSGLSSSAALDLCLLAGWNALGAFGLEDPELAVIGWEADNRYVGVKCGVMDQMASALGRKGHAIFIDTRTRDWDYCPLPEGLAIAVLDTRKPRALASSAYNERVRECAEAASAVARLHPSVAALRDVDAEMLEEARRDGLAEIPYRRARHVVSENARALEFRAALADRDLGRLGELCRASHESLRDDYEVSCPELDAMARAAWCAPGCVAARMTGAGFGGCCVALAEASEYDEFEAGVKASYGMYGFAEPDLFKTWADDGAHALLLERGTDGPGR